MNLPFLPSKILIFIIPLVMFSTLQKGHANDFEQYSKCLETKFECGQYFVEMSYPFWGNNRPSYCGLEGFELTCDNEKKIPRISINSFTFRVLNISQSDHEIWITSTDLEDDTSLCPPVLSSTFLNRTRFGSNPKSELIYVYYDCPDGLDIDFSGNLIWDEFKCMKKGVPSIGYYVAESFSEAQAQVFEQCKIQQVAPVLRKAFEEYRKSESMSLIEVLKQGFTLDFYFDEVACSACVNSSGLCGSIDTDAKRFQCLCRDGAYPVSCPKRENWKTGPAKDSKKSNKFHGYIKVLVIVPLSVALFVLLTVTYWFIKKKKTGIARRKQESINLISSNINNYGISVHGSPTGEEGNDIGTSTSDVKIYPLSTIVAATENFSLAHKVGEGGFGSVYKGKLHNGQDIAVKRLSNTSEQGMEEFRNEVKLIAKLQHRNLVRLFGYCTQNEEKMLIYEYLPNKGLDCFLFDKEKNGMLDWEKRFNIILGIARGMVYLHHDSRLRIIHRDLKASNILLDAHLNPKISDFGMARISGRDQIEEQTRRVVGTYGYMSPEYAMQGHFSIKSDVFSFGVLLLEIITGRKSSSYYTEDSVNLIGHVWDLWRESNVLEVVDQSLGESRHLDPRILRCIHIGLLCVQESATARPSMSEVVLMLCNETSLPSPGQAAFIFRASARGPTSSSSTSVGANPTNELTISTIEAR